MEYIVGDSIGLIHLIASVLSLISGTMVLVMKKGTLRHKQIGYIYVVSMGILIITAFMIYRLFKGWGIFHYMTVLSLVTLLIGMLPLWAKNMFENWKHLHFSFMYWSIIGLYSAFVAEIMTRIPESPFYSMIGLASGIVIFLGALIFVKKSPKWAEFFKESN